MMARPGGESVSPAIWWRSPTGVGLAIVAAAIVVHAFTQRYSFTHLGGLYMSRGDRLTGRLELCVGKRDGSMACAPATKPPHQAATDSAAP